ncbi:tRNA (N(6)-L-threonylcarbamoyladenosine(37)-C(2))-methylthiotransferase MtaB [Phocaeicola faecicola]|jgi:threonylcarbamoyladenosine tRNA methylthiotransferase MtaB|uniref:tRNA (N(6)-L-threonylcarbamoyladenosine(37)-C(2))- methylthiotransferase MtaB n=1 Tax=Phocaeicola faecicola TaxID=2739389 RepID=UPI0015E7B376|nr:tRNA (N(6)-L-threonylcarbamoyladenosine(37)-C(2))-methylthiotransferase MtaB [Phocaeicola faecicola]MCI5742700.1 tRNA (N(6)-L-threonylcarbamoyladenosine(37)-C(2))-methylthiotransferase MtaB [Bacteroides sp.]MDD6907515.1 tRNA (N(6)-L-threonylcarbamoyladenosine(37)-C(2))-methylthiotransferase MtaB [Bacteroidaceae bacterium]MDY4871400.1 tRNA (N(6)-L-threonylcarbamoyladenosine(37)-C(2))-methylthiotransferase MtaB [Phocaeicola faecicola]
MIDTSIFQDKKAVYYTLGCKLNFAETSTIGKTLKEAGVRTVRRGEKADICVINTCSVTEMADKKCRQAIHRLTKEHPGAFVVVTGCYAQLKPDQVSEIEGVDLVLGAEQKGDLVNYLGNLEKHAHGEAVITATKDIRTFVPSCSRGDRTRYFLKVQDGCDYFCSYCTIPFARGRSRNGRIADLVAQAREVAAEGGKEIVLTGVNIGDFGKSTGETFFDLIRALDEVEGIERYRISSIEPNLLTDEIIDFVASSKRFMPHFHIPLQSGCDEVLKLMRRRYDTALFAHKIQRIKELMPDAFIGVDVIVGTRGETPEYFEQAYEFIRGLDITQLHVFSYSERPGTQALKIDYVVPAEEKHRRSQRLLALSDEKTKSFYMRYIGKEAKVLMEHSKPGTKMHGFTDNYIRVELENDDRLDNQIVDVRLGEFNEETVALQGNLKNKPYI